MGVLAVTSVADAINPVEGDLALTAEGRLFLREDKASIVDQRIRTKAFFRKGEWFLNLDAGTPYFEHILDKPTEAVLRAIFTQMFLDTEGVQEVQTLTFDFDRRARKVTVNFRLKLTDGSTYATSQYGQFVLAS